MALLGRTVTKSINENTRARLIMAWLSGLLLMAIALSLKPRLVPRGTTWFDNFVHNAHTEG